MTIRRWRSTPAPGMQPRSNVEIALAAQEGNQILTSYLARILTVLLIAEGITILKMAAFVALHVLLVW